MNDYKMSLSLFKDAFWGEKGFDELKKYMKQSSDFCKEIAVILQERAELENAHAKGLNKLASKLMKVARDSLGSAAAAWQAVATEMENEGLLHKNLAIGLIEDITKPLKNIIETHHKSKKMIESVVDKTTKAMIEKRNEDTKYKRMCHLCAKENEKLQEQMSEMRTGKGKPVNEKDVSKMEAKCKKADESLKKADQEYHDACLKAERCRQEWESQVYKGSNQFQIIEEEKISHLQDVILKYNSHLSVLGPKLIQICERIEETSSHISVDGDIKMVISQKGTGPNIPQLILCDFYAEDVNNPMNKERRRQALERVLSLLKLDIEKEKKGKEGVEHLAQVYRDTPNYADEEAREEVSNKLNNVNTMLDFLQVCYHKICCAISNLDDAPIPSLDLTKYVEYQKDKQGATQTILRIPLGAPRDNRDDDDISLRGFADGGYLENTYDNIDYELHRKNSSPMVCRCRALYEYAAKLEDELSIQPGDVISIHKKQKDGWWQGELNGKIGIFPASYVCEF